jgi:hypothetical protein
VGDKGTVTVQAKDGQEHQVYGRERIPHALQQAKGNRSVAARRLHIHRSALYNKLKRYYLTDSPSGTARTPVHLPGQQNSLKERSVGANPAVLSLIVDNTALCIAAPKIISAVISES